MRNIHLASEPITSSRVPLTIPLYNFGGHILGRHAGIEVDFGFSFVAGHVVAEVGLGQAGHDENHVDIEAGHLASQRLR